MSCFSPGPGGAKNARRCFGKTKSTRQRGFAHRFGLRPVTCLWPPVLARGSASCAPAWTRSDIHSLNVIGLVFDAASSHRMSRPIIESPVVNGEQSTLVRPLYLHPLTLSSLIPHPSSIIPVHAPLPLPVHQCVPRPSLHLNTTASVGHC